MNKFNESSMFFFYNSLPNKTAGIRLRVRLKEKIDPEALQNALERTVRRNPFFRLKPILDENGNICCEQNSVPPGISPEDGTRVLLGTEDTDGYLFRVRYTEDTIILFASHVLTDGRGVISFLKSLLYNYFTDTGKVIGMDGSFLTDDTEEDPEETKNIFEDLPDDIKPLAPKEELKEVFSVPGERVLIETDQSRLFGIRFPKEQLKEEAKKRGTTPLPLLSVLFSDVLRKTYDTGDLTIRISSPVDMRRFLNEKAMTNYSISIETDIDANLNGFGMEDRINRVSEDIQKKISRDEILGRAAFAGANAMGAMEFPFGNEEICRGMMKKRITKRDTFSFLLTNMGLVRFPKDMEGLIADFDIVSPSVATTPSILTYTYGDHANVFMVANFEEDAFAKGILEELIKQGFDAEMTEDGYLSEDSLLTFKFEHR
ncbi:MAG: hypothetical protein K6A38_08450 [Lachnospiraceae bacterium]|nr:hypothetical protein [Lachnospiraceae bacterium]